MYRNQYCKGTIHAEANAIMKLPKLPRKSHLKRVDLLVIRTSRDGSLGCSKPCINCVQLLSEKLPDKGYSLHTVYFSTRDGEITATTLQRLKEEEAHVTRYYKAKLNNLM